ncbi:MAG: hypothetical protein COA78_25445 [Blastopirellula sp.]|nr:MAG: hypothetical protein COA78_25445 [Blastopirellula sp.]
MHVDTRFRIDVQAEWASSFIKRHAQEEKPFFLYVSFFAPHVPLEAPQKYLDRFPGEMPQRRRLALAMLSAVDDGVGLISRTLAAQGATNNTLIFYIGDNGAPLKIHKIDAPGGGPGWDGSLNDPWVGEKGMLTEGGIRVPYIMRWPDQIPKNKVYDRPAISLDATATSLVAAGLELDDKIDGVDLVPFLNEKLSGDPHEALFWRWAGQAAVRAGDWKYLQGDKRAYLFNVASVQHEKENLISQHPEIAKRLKAKLAKWADELVDPGLDAPLSGAGSSYFDHYLDGKLASHPKFPAEPGAKRQPKPAAKRKQPRLPADLFKVRDTDQDGFVTLKEFIGNPEVRNVPVLTKRFKQLDTNNDSRLTLDEMKN